MANDKKDLTLSDLDLNLDLDIERDKSSKHRIETSPSSKRLGSTLDYYNDEMSRLEVERLIRDHASMSASGEEELAASHMADSSADDGVDYAYMLNLLSEAKKTDGIKRDDTAKIVMRKTKYTRAYKTTRLALIAVIVVFLITSSFLVSKLIKSNAKITELEERVKELNTTAVMYEELSMDYDGQKDVIKQLTTDKTNLENTIVSLTGEPPTYTVEPVDTTANSGTVEPVDEGPTKYTVQNGDSYWRISAKFYNNGSYYKDILAANNITDESQGPHPGEELIIPKR